MIMEPVIYAAQRVSSSQLDFDLENSPVVGVQLGVQSSPVRTGLFGITAAQMVSSSIVQKSSSTSGHLVVQKSSPVPLPLGGPGLLDSASILILKGVRMGEGMIEIRGH